MRDHHEEQPKHSGLIDVPFVWKSQWTVGGFLRKRLAIYLINWVSISLYLIDLNCIYDILTTLEIIYENIYLAYNH